MSRIENTDSPGQNCFTTRRGFAIINHIFPENTFRYKEIYPNIFSFGDGVLIVPVTAERAKQLRLEYLADNTNKRMVNMKNWDTLHEKLYQLATISPIVPVEWYKEAEAFLDKAISDVEVSLKCGILDIDKDKLIAVGLNLKNGMGRGSELVPGKAEVVKWDGGDWMVQVVNVGIVPRGYIERHTAEKIANWFNELLALKPKDIPFENLVVSLLKTDSGYRLSVSDIGFVGSRGGRWVCREIQNWFGLFLAQKKTNQRLYEKEKAHASSANNHAVSSQLGDHSRRSVPSEEGQTPPNRAQGQDVVDC